MTPPLRNLKVLNFMETENTPNINDDMHWQREMIGVIRIHLRSWLSFAGTISRDLCEIHGPHRPESKTPQELIDFMFLNAEEVTADFLKLIQKEL